MLFSNGRRLPTRAAARWRPLGPNPVHCEVTRVTLDPDKAGQLDLPPIPGVCPLFHRDAGGHGVCPVHETRPDVSAEYVCWRILVIGSGGGRAARVMGSRHIAIDDPAVESVLSPHRAALARAFDDGDWDAALAVVPGLAGFRVMR